jgi:hypothetical protein
VNHSNAILPARGDAPPRFSILIGMVSTEDRHRILETLNALRNQAGDSTYEVVIADRRDDEVGEEIDRAYPEARRLPCPGTMSLPEMRTLALDHASGDLIIVTEDHCVPSLNWLESIAHTFENVPAGTVAVGGCVENGVSESRVDRATFLCEYSFFLEPVEEGVTHNLPGMNVAYHRSALEAMDRKLLTSGFWETTVHPCLLERGMKLYSTNSIRIFHCKKFSFRLFASQRYIYSKYFAGLRTAQQGLPRRILMAGASVVLPALLLYRSIKQARSKGRFDSRFRSALPPLLVFYGIWAVGEMAGYLRGSGDALARWSSPMAIRVSPAKETSPYCSGFLTSACGPTATSRSNRSARKQHDSTSSVSPPASKNWWRFIMRSRMTSSRSWQFATRPISGMRRSRHNTRSPTWSQTPPAIRCWTWDVEPADCWSPPAVILRR